jgi:acyl-CoA thioester hydrolase
MRIGDPPSSNPDDFAFTHRVRVRFSETDAMGVVHHSRYLPYLEEARVAYLRANGHPYHETREGGTDFAIIEQWVGYIQPLRFDEEVDVHLRLAHLTRATFQMHYVLTVAGEVRASAITAHSAVNHDGRPVRVPSWLSEFVQAE